MYRNLRFSKKVSLKSSDDEWIDHVQVYVLWTEESGIAQIDFLGGRGYDYMTLDYPSLQLVDMMEGIEVCQELLKSMQQYVTNHIQEMKASVSHRNRNDKSMYDWYMAKIKDMPDDDDKYHFISEFGEWIWHHFDMYITSETGSDYFNIPFVQRLMKYDYDQMKSMFDGMKAAGLQKCTSPEAMTNLLEFFDGNVALCVQTVKPKACEATRAVGLCECADWETCQHCPNAEKPHGFYFNFLKILNGMV